MIQIFVDALCDISLEKQRELDIGVLPYLFEIEGKEYLTSEVDSKQITSFLQKGIKVKTARPALNIWKEMIKKHLDRGEDIFYIASTSKMTGALASFNVLSNLFKKDYPNRKLEVFDTLLASTAPACITEDIVSQGDLTSLEKLSFKVKCLSNSTFCRGSLKDTSIFVGNNRLSEISKRIPVIVMKEGLVHIDKEFDSKEESLNYIWDEIIHKKIKRLNISYSPDVEEAYIYNFLKSRGFDFDIPHSISQMNSCMLSYLGLSSISISYIED